MAFRATCPQCLTSYRLPDHQANKRVRCKYCTATFLAAASGDAGEKVEAVPLVEEVSDHFKVQHKRPPYEHFQQEDRDRRLTLAKYREGSSGSGSVALILGIVGGVLALLLLAGVLAWILAVAGRPAEAQPAAAFGVPPPDAPPPDIPPAAPLPLPARPVEVEGVAQGPTSVGSALEYLRGDDAHKKLALVWLRTAPVEKRLREEVAEALNPALASAALRSDALPVVARWGGKANVPKLTALLDEPNQPNWAQVVEILAKVEDDGALEAAARQLAVSGRTALASQSLRESSPRYAERHVVKYLHHPETEVRREAAQLLRHYRTSGPLLVEQARLDLEAGDARSRLAACETLAKQKPLAGPQARVAKALEARLEDAEALVGVAAMASLEQWATRDNVKAVCAAMKHAVLQPSALRILARLKDERSIEPLVPYLLSPHARAVAELLVSFGDKAEKPTWPQLENRVPAVRALACVVLGEVGGKESRERLAKLAAKDKVNRRVALEAIKKIDARRK